MGRAADGARIQRHETTGAKGTTTGKASEKACDTVLAGNTGGQACETDLPKENAIKAEKAINVIRKAKRVMFITDRWCGLTRGEGRGSHGDKKLEQKKKKDKKSKTKETEVTTKTTTKERINKLMKEREWD